MGILQTEGDNKWILKKEKIEEKFEFHGQMAKWIIMLNNEILLIKLCSKESVIGVLKINEIWVL